MTTVEQCSQDQCRTKRLALGLCSAHYRRHQLGQPMDTPVKTQMPITPCVVKGCDRNRRTQAGLCAAHNNRLRRYALTPEGLEALLASQDDRCAACRDPLGPRWHIDHDHACCLGPTTCGRCVRSILCRRCNQALGMVSDDVVILRQLIAYLEGQS